MDKNDETKVIQGLQHFYGYFHNKFVRMCPKGNFHVDHYYKEGTIRGHLDGRYALAVFAGPKATRFISIDIDTGGKEMVRRVMKVLEELGIPRDKMYVSLSGRKGYHVDVFFAPFIYNTDAKNLYELMIWRGGFDPKKIEFRPTPKQAIKMPLGIHPATGRRCWFLDRDTLEPIEDMLYVCDIQSIAQHDLREMLHVWNKKRWNELYADMIIEDSGHREKRYDPADKDGFYERFRLTEPGTRHNTAVRLAVALRRSGMVARQIEIALNGWYYRQEYDLIDTDEDEVLRDNHEIAAWAESEIKAADGVSLTADVKPFTMTARDVACILMAPTVTARKAAFLIWCFAKLFGSSKISYAAIADMIGCSPRAAQDAVMKLCNMRLLGKLSGGLKMRGGVLIRMSNTYFIPGEYEMAKMEFPSPDCFKAEQITIADRVSKETFPSLYSRVLSEICSDAYLATVLTGSEMEAVIAERSSESDDAEDSANDAGRCI